MRIKKLVKSEWSCGKGHLWSAKGFSVWPRHLTSFFFISVSLSNFSFQPILVLKKDILVWNVKTYGLAIWEWLFGMGVIFAKLLQKQIKFFWGAFNDYMHTILPFSDPECGHISLVCEICGYTGYTLRKYLRNEKKKIIRRIPHHTRYKSLS